MLRLDEQIYQYKTRTVNKKEWYLVAEHHDGVETGHVDRKSVNNGTCIASGSDHQWLQLGACLKEHKSSIYDYEIELAVRATQFIKTSKYASRYIMKTFKHF